MVLGFFFTHQTWRNHDEIIRNSQVFPWLSRLKNSTLNGQVAVWDAGFHQGINTEARHQAANQGPGCRCCSTCRRKKWPHQDLICDFSGMYLFFWEIVTGIWSMYHNVHVIRDFFWLVRLCSWLLTCVSCVMIQSCRTIPDFIRKGHLRVDHLRHQREYGVHNVHRGFYF